MPRPPLYWGSTAVIPNSGEKYAMERGTSSPSDWYHRPSVRYLSRSARNASSRSMNALSDASSWNRADGTCPSSFTGSWPLLSHSSASTEANRSWVGGCQDQRRLPTSSPSACNGGGRTGRTVNRRMARTP
jgi:hypothetical protein